MLDEYSKFIEELQDKLSWYFNRQKDYIKCVKGCGECCKNGEFPYSRIEFAYITSGYIELPDNIKIAVQNNIKSILEKREKNKRSRFLYDCPFLINNECCVYEKRGIICRTYGLAYFDNENRYIRLPACVNDGKNFSEYYNKKNKKQAIPDIIYKNLRTDKLLTGEIAQKYKFDAGEIRPMIEWVINPENIE